jgi:hypothetical protein
LFILGLVFALATSLGVVAVREGLDETVRGPAAIAALLTAPPLAVIPNLTEDDEGGGRNWRVILAWLVAALLAGALLLTAVHVFYRPLNVLWALSLQRLGL